MGVLQWGSRRDGRRAPRAASRSHGRRRHRSGWRAWVWPGAAGRGGHSPDKARCCRTAAARGRHRFRCCTAHRAPADIGRRPPGASWSSSSTMYDCQTLVRSGSSRGRMISSRSAEPLTCTRAATARLRATRSGSRSNWHEHDGRREFGEFVVVAQLVELGNGQVQGVLPPACPLDPEGVAVCGRARSGPHGRWSEHHPRHR